MTNRQAITVLKKIITVADKSSSGIKEIDGTDEEAIQVAIKALEQEPKIGHWIRWREEVQRGTHYTESIPHCKCSECGKKYDPYSSQFIKYCPNCGAKMVETAGK